MDAGIVRLPPKAQKQPSAARRLFLLWVCVGLRWCRLSTITDADLILYMEDGNIVESGNHETLLARGGRYAALYNSQFS